MIDRGSHETLIFGGMAIEPIDRTNRPVIIGRNDGCDECDDLGYICDECVDDWLGDEENNDE